MNRYKAWRRLTVSMLISSMILFLPNCTHGVAYRSLPHTDTLWFMPQLLLDGEKCDPTIRYMLIRYTTIDPVLQFVERKTAYITRRCNDNEYGMIKMNGQCYGNRITRYGLVRVDSLQYDLLFFKSVYLPPYFQNYRSQYLNLHDRCPHEITDYPYPLLLWPCLRFVDDKICTNDEGETIQYHLFYGQDIDIYVGHYAIDSLYFYFDNNMRLKKVLHPNNVIVYSTLEDMEFR